jgi:glycosyltransferase involved in cell wall biosynthesis
MAGSDPRERTSLVVTVLDEAGTIDTLLESIASQTQPPDEVVIVDGGSCDGTWAKLEAWNARLQLPRLQELGRQRPSLRLIQAPGAGIARGRNLAIEAASGELIAVTDAGVRLERDWLAQLLARHTTEVGVVSGFFKADPQTTFERAMGATVLPTVEDVDPRTFLPSSRSVLFRRAAWQAVGGYPEWLDYCEDLVFDLAVQKAGCTFAFAPQAIAWFRPRGSLRSFFRQYYLYARGDGKADLWRRRHAIRYASYLLGLLLVRRGGRWSLGLLAACGLAYVLRPYLRLRPLMRQLPPREIAYAAAIVPVIRLVGDVAKMLGYPVGMWWRLRRTWTSRSSS